MALTVAGGIAIDIVGYGGQSPSSRVGGSALYAGLAARALTNVHVVGAVGGDRAARLLLKLLTQQGMGLSDVAVVSGRTARWGCAYEPGEPRRTVLADPGVTAGWSPSLSSTASSTNVLLLGAGDPSVQLAVRRQMSDAVYVGVDTIDHWIVDYGDEVLAAIARADLVFIGRDEAHQLTGSWSLRAVSEALLLDDDQALVVKGGSHGSWLLHQSQRWYVPVCHAERVQDSTGAGDAYAGACMAIISGLRERPKTSHIRHAMLYAAAAGSVTVEGDGVEPLLSLNAKNLANRVALLQTQDLIYRDMDPRTWYRVFT